MLLAEDVSKYRSVILSLPKDQFTMPSCRHERPLLLVLFRRHDRLRASPSSSTATPVASALCFTFTIVFMAGLFVMLSAFFLAAVQILVTAGAVMVLFLFIIMLLDLTAMEHMPRQKIWMGCSLVLALGFLLSSRRRSHGTPQGLVTTDSLTTPGVKSVAQGSSPGTTQEISTSDLDQHDDTHRIGRLLFDDTHRSADPSQASYVAPFEITSLLILVATIGVIVLCKQDEPSPPAAARGNRPRSAARRTERETALKT